MRRTALVTLIVLVVAALGIGGSVTSCGRENPTLDHIDGIVDRDPRTALAILSTLDQSELSSGELARYNFLTLKATDKAYITHTSDSLYSAVLDYERRHKGNGRYAETLYYGGRVYFDLGDYPTALEFFHSALNHLPADTLQEVDLRTRIYGQTSLLLNVLRLYDEALPMGLKALELIRRHNPAYVVSSLRSVGSIYIRSGRYEDAERILDEAYKICQAKPNRQMEGVRDDLAIVKYHLGKTDEALALIRQIPRFADTPGANNALSYAIQIYLQAGLTDSAYIFAQRLRHSASDVNRWNAYNYLFSPSLFSRIDRDSLADYAVDYRRLMDHIYDDNQNRLALEQQAHYNYSLKERRLLQAENQRLRLQFIAMALVLGLFISVCVIGAMVYRKRSQDRKLAATLSEVARLNTLLDTMRRTRTLPRPEFASEDADPDDVVFVPTEVFPQWDELRAKIRTEPSYEPLDRVIEDFPSRTAISQYLNEGRMLPDDNPLWQELENDILDVAPSFRDVLFYLTQGRITHDEYRTAMLIKIGLRPSEISTLLGREKQTISSRRESIAGKIFATRMAPMYADRVVRAI